MSEIFVPGKISKVTTLDQHELRVIELTLPEQHEVEGVMYRVRDTMRPGTAFLAKPFGIRTGKIRRRMYTRSNSSSQAPGRLETVINHTHLDKSDTSPWWQSNDVLIYQQNGTPIDVRVEWNEDRSHLIVYENAQGCLPANLRLEPDVEWKEMRFLGLAFATGITPFLSYLRYMKEQQFGKCESQPGIHFTLVASARYFRQLIDHEELLELEQGFPENFRYHPVLTRESPPDWSYTSGRIMRAEPNNVGEPQIDLTPLCQMVPEIEKCHVRLCGNRQARDQLQAGLQRHEITPRSFRAEVW